MNEPALRYGRIVFTWMEDRNGHAKLRPALVITPTDEIADAAQIVVMAITTTFPEPAPTFCVKLPWHPSGRVRTGLTRRSAAVVNWIDAVHRLDVVGFGGDVPRKIMDIIQDKLANLDKN